jgi:hypothetical protein
MKYLSIAWAALALLSGAATASTPFITFDFENGQLENGFGGWAYEDLGLNSCDVYGGDGRATLCGPDGLNIAGFYATYNNNHMGWMRYGFLDAETEVSISGGALRVQMTGGVYRNEAGELVEVGEQVFSKSMYTTPTTEQRRLPGDLPLYFKTASSTTPFKQFEGINRLSMWVWFPEEYRGMEGYNKENYNAPQRSFSLYPFIDTSKRGHYYHKIANVRMGGWTKVQFDAHPTHHNGGVSGANNSFLEGGYEYKGDGVAYFANMTTFALRPEFAINLPPEAHFIIDEIETDYVKYENEETISSLAVGFDPNTQRFDIAFADKYRCADCSAQYEVRYSFSPIDNANFPHAHLPEKTINFDRSLSNDQGVIHKPHNGYNELWAALELKDEHRARLVEGEVVYFAVKDISWRRTMQNFADLKSITVPGVGRVQVQRLVKTISYPIYLPPMPITFEQTDLPQVEPGTYYKGSIPFRGGVAPFDVSISGDFPAGLTISEYGQVRGVTQQHGDFDFDITVTDARGDTATSSHYLRVAPSQVALINNCGLLVDFVDSAEASVLADPRFDTVIHDRYTGFNAIGTRIRVGENKDYDYQGVSGIGASLQAGDVLRMTWYNNGSQPVIFSPRVSFDVAGRYERHDDALWHTSPAQTIEPGAHAVALFTLDAPVETDVINVNVNHAQSGTLILDKLELVEQARAYQDVCKEPVTNAEEKTFMVVDFHESIESSRRGISGLQTLVKDAYTDFADYGVAPRDANVSSRNYQGVTGNGFRLEEGDKIRITWRNTESGYRVFYPMISFDDADHVDKGMTGTWWDMGRLGLSPTRRQITTMTITAEQAGVATAINVAQNNAEAHMVSVEKIELITPRDVIGIETLELPSGMVTQPYQQQLDYAGTDEEVYFVANSSLPTGMQLSGDGVLLGEPEKAGVYDLVISVYSASGESSVRELQLEILPADFYDTAQCVPLINFDPAQPYLDPLLSEIIQDRYTDIHLTGMTTVIGSNQAYNYQGAKGQLLNDGGGELRMVWFNASESAMTFAPRVSVLSDERYDRYAPSGTWLEGEAITLQPSTRGVSVVWIPDGYFGVVNVNSNAPGNRTILLERVEHVNAAYRADQICSMMP